MFKLNIGWKTLDTIIEALKPHIYDAFRANYLKNWRNVKRSTHLIS